MAAAPVASNAIAAKTRVFISYSRKDIAFADRLEAALTARGIEVLIDREEIYAFEDWWKRIETLIGRTDTVVFVLSPDSVSSGVALKEVAYAASLNKRFAPILYRRVEDRVVPDALRRLNFIFFDDLGRFEASANALANALDTDINWIRQHTEYGEAERRWSSAGRPNGLLLQSPTLELAEYWLTSHPRNAPEPTNEIQAYVFASRKRARTSQRVRRLVQTSIFALMTGIILGLVGWINQDYLKAQWRWWTVARPYAVIQVWPHVLSAAKEQALKAGQSFKECAQDCAEMIVIPTGSFMMGGPEKIEGPEHSVTIAKPFAVSKYEVTFADWNACVAGGGCNGYTPNDEGWGRGQHPVINVTFDDAQRYVAWFSEMTGKTYRLLSEAEYEYAARAGTQTTYPWGDDIKLKGTAMAKCQSCGSDWDNDQTVPVGPFAPNQFGLYDMVGNVWEWTEDCKHWSYDDAPTDGSPWIEGACNDRMFRGGSWLNSPDRLRSASRYAISSSSRTYDVGFRIARTLHMR